MLLGPFPAELVLEILNHIRSFKALSRLARCSKELNSLASPVLLLRDDESGRHDALRKGCQIGFTHLLELAADAGVTISSPAQGTRLLSQAVEYGNVDAIRILVTRFQVDPNAVTTRASPMHRAIQSRKVEVVKALLSVGASPNEANCGRENVPPLHYCLKARSPDSILGAMIDAGADLEHSHGIEEKPLELAARLGLTHRARYLLIRGASAADGSAICYAARCGYLGTLKMFLKELDINIPEFENSGWFLIHAAVQSSNVDMVKFLIECGVDVNRPDLRQGQRSLEMAIDEWRWKPAIIRLLLGAGADLATPGDGGLLPIHLAVQGKKLAAVKILLEYGADPNIPFPYPDIYGESQLVSSIRIDGDVAVALLQGGADANTRGSDGIPAFILAARSRNTKVYLALRRHGADVNATDIDEQNALHQLAMGREAKHTRLLRKLTVSDSEVAGHLIKLGVEVQAKDRHGMTPLHYAVQLGNRDIADHLLQAGADVDAADFEGQIPEWFVAMQQRQLLLELKKSKIRREL